MSRDEVLAEWRFSEDRAPELHLYCHLSGDGYLPIHASLRSHIFQREMPLVRSFLNIIVKMCSSVVPRLLNAYMHNMLLQVLRAIKHADADFLSGEQLLAAAVVVHLSSHIQVNSSYLNRSKKR